MTVRELHEHTDSETNIYLFVELDEESSIKLDRGSVFAIQAFGDYIINNIHLQDDAIIAYIQTEITAKRKSPER